MKSYIKKGFTLLGEEGAGRIAGFLITFLITRAYSQEEVGYLFAGIALMGNIVNIGDLGLLPLGFTEAAKPKEKQEFRPVDIFRSRLSSFTILTPLVFVIVLFLPLESTVKTIYLFFTGAVFIDALSPQWYFKAKQQFSLTTTTALLTALLYLSLMAGAVKLLQLPIHLIPLVYIVAHIGGSLFLTWKAKFKPLPGFQSIHQKTIKASLSVGAGRMLQQLPFLLPPLLITSFASYTERITPANTAGFGAAFRIILMMKVLDRIISTIFLSSLPKLWEENREKTTHRVQQLFTLITVGGTALSIIILYGAPKIMSLFSESYADYGITLALLAPFLVLTMLNSVVSYGILAIGVRKDFMKASLWPTLILLPFLILLTWLYADRGAAIGINILELGIFLLSALYFRKHISLSVKPIAILLPIPIAIVALYYFQSYLVSSIAVAVAILMAGFYTLKTFRRESSGA